MAYDTSFNGRVYDTETGYELIVTDGKVVARVQPGNEWMIDAQTGVTVELAPGQSYAITGSGHPVILNAGQEWVDLPSGPTLENPAGGFVRDTPSTSTPAPTPESTPEGAPA